jgi:putative pyruvate formate lyase activating enzyme
MPGLLDDTRQIMHWIADKLSRDSYVNVMDQYYPAHKAESGGYAP